MVVAEAERGHGQEGQMIAGVCLQRMALADDHRPFFDSTYAQNADLWLHRLPAGELEVFEGSGALPHAEQPSQFSGWLEEKLATVS